MAFYLLLGLAYAACLVPLAAVIWLGWSFSRHARPPLWPAGMLLFLSCGALFLMFRHGAPDSPLVEILLAGIVACWAVSLALLARRCCRWPFARLLGVWLVLLLGIYGMIDWRFRLEVEDPRGELLPIMPRLVGIESYSHLAGYQRIEGRAMGRGRLYFGFASWLRVRKGGWMLFGNLVTPDGSFLDRAEGRISEWQDWPLRRRIPDERIGVSTGEGHH